MMTLEALSSLDRHNLPTYVPTYLPTYIPTYLRTHLPTYNASWPPCSCLVGWESSLPTPPFPPSPDHRPDNCRGCGSPRSRRSCVVGSSIGHHVHAYIRSYIHTSIHTIRYDHSRIAARSMHAMHAWYASSSSSSSSPSSSSSSIHTYIPTYLLLTTPFCQVSVSIASRKWAKS